MDSLLGDVLYGCKQVFSSINLAVAGATNMQMVLEADAVEMQGTIHITAVCTTAS